MCGVCVCVCVQCSNNKNERIYREYGTYCIWYICPTGRDEHEFAGEHALEAAGVEWWQIP